MKGAAFVMPIREQFVASMLEKYDEFNKQCDDAAASLVAWELYDPSKVVEGDEGSFANRGYHLNSLIMPMWTKAENDGQCRQWAREMSLMFKHELEAHDQRTSEGVEGGASVRGHKGAVLLYGNYDVSVCLCTTMPVILTPFSNMTRSQKTFSGPTTLACASLRRSTIPRMSSTNCFRFNRRLQVMSACE